MKTLLKISTQFKKALYLFYILVFLCTIFIISCNKDENVYSCNPQVNEWAKKYKNSFVDITRSQLVQIPRKYQMAVYRTLPPEKKLAFWKEKLEIESANETSLEIKSRISELEASLKIEYYNLGQKDSIPIEHRSYLDNWEKDLLLNFKMDSVQYLTRFCTLMTKAEIYTLVYQADQIDLSWLDGHDEINIDSAPGGGGPAPLPDCECLYNVYCSIFLNVDCAESGCTQTNSGCGVTGTSKCKGICGNSMSK